MANEGKQKQDNFKIISDELNSYLQQMPEGTKMVQHNLLRELMKKLGYLPSTRLELRLS